MTGAGWRGVGELARLLDAEDAASLLVDSGLDVASMHPDHLRLKPGESALVGFVVDGRDADGRPIAIPGYARTFTSPERAATILAKRRAKRVIDTTFGPGVVVTPSGHTVISLFPNDGMLHGLHRISRVGPLMRHLARLPEHRHLRPKRRHSTISPVRYKPERRFVARVQAGFADDRAQESVQRDLHVRWFPDGRGEFLTAVAAALVHEGVAVAQPIGTTDDGRLTVEETVLGNDGVEAMLDGTLDPEALGALIARLHGSRSADGLLAPRRITAGDVLARTLTSLSTLAFVDPNLIGPATRLATALRALGVPDGPQSAVHGDLHLHQVLHTAHGPVLVDLERCGIGSPLLDLATTMAHLEALALQDPAAGTRLTSAAAALRGSWIGSSRASDAHLGPYLSAALIDRALLAFRCLEPGWRDTASITLALAIEALRAPIWRIAHPRPSGAWTAMGPGAGAGRTALTIEPGRIVVQDPASDAELPALARLLSLGELRAYRPGRRAVVELDGAYAKVVRPRRASDLVVRLRTVEDVIRRSGVPLRVPRVLTVEDDGVVVLEALPGRALHAWLGRGVPEADRIAAITSAADVLVALRRCDLASVDLPPAQDGGPVAEWSTLVARTDPLAAPAYAAVADALGPPPRPERPGLVHGDLHDRNVLLGSPTGGLIDLDGIGVGDPALDAGNLAAHLFLRALQREEDVVVGQRDARTLLDRIVTDRARATAWGARTLFRLAVLYRFRMPWAHLTPALLEESAIWADSDAAPIA